jgi:CRISPR-associated endoribonuclease Cas6
LPHSFDLIALRFQCTVRREGTVSANFLRGGFGRSLRSVDRSAYERWFEPHSIDGPSGLRDSPRAFVIRAPEQAGARFDFGFHLFDVSAGSIETAIRAFQEFVDVESVAEPEVLQLPLDSDRAASRVRVSFVTPTELKGAERPEFAVLFARLRDRISTLRALYQGGPLEIDFKGMAERAGTVKMTRCEIQYVDAERVSRNTLQRHSLGGFVGFAEYEGELGEFLPYLEIGRYTGVGRQTVWGKGEIHAVVA